MANKTYTLIQLEQELSENISDWIEVDTTTNISTNNSILSTSLNAYDDGRDDRFNLWWVYIMEGNNITVHRQISDYVTSTGTLTVRGAALLAEAGAVTIRLGRYKRTDKVKAIQRAVKNVYPTLFKSVDNKTLVTGNELPNAHMDDWTSTSALSLWSTSTATLTKTTTAGLFRGGSASAKVTVSAANGYLVCGYNQWNRLLDLMGKTMTFRGWVYPEVANDAKLQIYTLKADGTAQTLSSSTTCPAGKWTLLELEDQALNDDLVDIQFRCVVATDTKYAYFDNLRVVGVDQCEYLLPQNLQEGDLIEVYHQSSNNADYPCDDINPEFSQLLGGDVIDDGTYKFLKFNYSPSSEYLLRLRGTTPLETVSADTETITIDEIRLDMLSARAKYEFWHIVKGSPSSEDIDRYRLAEAEAYREYIELLSTKAMSHSSISMRIV